MNLKYLIHSGKQQPYLFGGADLGRFLDDFSNVPPLFVLTPFLCLPLARVTGGNFPSSSLGFVSAVQSPFEQFTSPVHLSPFIHLGSFASVGLGLSKRDSEWLLLMRL